MPVYFVECTGCQMSSLNNKMASFLISLLVDPISFGTLVREIGCYSAGLAAMAGAALCVASVESLHTCVSSWMLSNMVPPNALLCASTSKSTHVVRHHPDGQRVLPALISKRCIRLPGSLQARTPIARLVCCMTSFFLHPLPGPHSCCRVLLIHTCSLAQLPCCVLAAMCHMQAGLQLLLLLLLPTWMRSRIAGLARPVRIVLKLSATTLTAFFMRSSCSQERSCEDPATHQSRL